jgi:preprotein translocase subunit SecA
VVGLWLAPANEYATANALAGARKAGGHCTVDEKDKNVVLKEVGYRDGHRALGVDSFVEGTWAPFMTDACKAKELCTKDVECTVVTDDSGESVELDIPVSE